MATHTPSFEPARLDAQQVTDLVETLMKIGVLCSVAEETGDHLTKDDLLDFLDQIQGLSAEAATITGATQEQCMAVFQALLDRNAPPSH